MAETVKASSLIEQARIPLAEGWGYIWGAYGQIHTQKAQNSATRAQTKKWGQQWVGKRVLDCSGLFYWAYKNLGGYMYHGANSMWNKYTTQKGQLKKGKRTDGEPLKPGCAVFLYDGKTRHHVGMYIGGGKVIEAKGTYYGVVQSSVAAWDEWGEMKTTDYDLEDTDQAAETGVSVPTNSTESPDITGSQPDHVPDNRQESEGKTVQVELQVLKIGNSGEQVKALQRLLNGSWYVCGAADGIFGVKTHAALMDMQKANGLTADGICGQNTWRKLLGA